MGKEEMTISGSASNKEMQRDGNGNKKKETKSKVFIVKVN